MKKITKTLSALLCASMLLQVASMSVWAKPGYSFLTSTNQGLVPQKEILFYEDFEDALSFSAESVWGESGKTLKIKENGTGAAISDGSLNVPGESAAKTLSLKRDTAIKGKFTTEFKFNIAYRSATPSLFSMGYFDGTTVKNAIELSVDQFVAGSDKFYRNIYYKNSGQTTNPLVDITSEARTSIGFQKWFLLYSSEGAWCPYGRDWYTLKAVIDTDAQKYSVYLNGSLCLKDEPFITYTSHSFSQSGINVPFVITTQGSAVKYDDLSIYREPVGRTTLYANDFNSYAENVSWQGAYNHATQRLTPYAGVAGMGLMTTPAKGGYIWAKNNALVNEFSNGVGGAFASAIKTDKNMTVEMDFKVSDFANDSYKDNWATILVFMPASGADGIRFLVSNDGKLGRYYYNRTTPYETPIISDITLNENHHLALYADYESGTCDLYIDNTLVEAGIPLLFSTAKLGQNLYYKEGEDVALGFGYHKESPTTTVTYDNITLYKDERDTLLSKAVGEMKTLLPGTCFVSGNISLPESDKTGYEIEWRSNSDVVSISSDGKSATVSPAYETKVVKLTAAVKDTNGEYTLSRDMEVSVLADDSYSDLSGVAGWTVSAGEAALAENPVNDADKSAKIPQGAHAYNTFNEVGGKVNVSVDMYLESTDKGTVYLADSNGEKVAEAGFKNLTLTLNPSDEGALITKTIYPTRKQFNLTFKADMLKRTYDVYIDNEKINNAPMNFIFKESPADNGLLSRIGFVCESGNLYADNIEAASTDSNSGMLIRHINYTDTDGDTIKHPKAGAKAVSVEISNTSKNKNAYVAAALYGSDGKQTGIRRKEVTSVPTGVTKVSIDEMTVPENWSATSFANAFIWDENMVPLTRSYKNHSYPTIYIAGDSMAASYSALSYPYSGWGNELYELLDGEKVNVINMAKEGKSVSQYIADGTGEEIAKRILPGDYLFIAFSYDDAKNSTAQTTYKQKLAELCNIAKENGAIPVFVTSPKDSSVDISTYVTAMKNAASESGTLLLDLNGAWNTMLASAAGEGVFYANNIDSAMKSDIRWSVSEQNSECASYNAQSKGKNGRLSPQGARKAASLLAELIESSSLEISSAVKEETQFTYTLSSNTLTVNGSGDMPVYTAFSKTPWKNASGVTAIKISEGITSVSSEAFSGFENLSKVYLPKTLNVIDENAFPENGSFTLYGENNSVGQRLEKADSSIDFAFEKLRILSIGNSHTMDYKQWKDLIVSDLQSAGLETQIELDYITVGGAQLCSSDILYVGTTELRSHYIQGSNPNRPYYNTYAKLRDKEYDLVLLQDYRESVMDSHRADFKENLYKTVRWIRNEQPTADVAWVADWTDLNSASNRNNLYEQWSKNSVAMMRAVEENEQSRPDFIVPMSTALQNARSSYLGSVYNAADCYADNSNTDWNGTNGITNFTILERDGTHCSYELGRYIVGAAVFGKVFDVYADSLDGFDFDFFDALGASKPVHITNSIYPWNGEMTESHFQIMREAGRGAIANPLTAVESAYTTDPADAIANSVKNLSYTDLTKESIVSDVNGASLGITITADNVSIDATGESASVTFLYGYTKKTVAITK